MNDVGRSVFFSIRKVDEEKRMVYGRLTQEMMDSSGEIMDYETSKPEFEAWRDETLAMSGGKSMGAGRSMHSPDVAAGKVAEMTFSDAEKAIDIGYKVVDDNEWNKVLEGVYTGFSVGGSSFGRRWPDPVQKRKNPRTGRIEPAIRYTVTPSEASLADRPCIRTATFFEIQKTDGTMERRQFKGAAMGDVKKSLYLVQDFAGVLQQVKYLQSKIADEAAMEQDGSAISEQVKNWLADGAKLLPSYVSEEVSELIKPQSDFLHVDDSDTFEDLSAMENDDKAVRIDDIAKGDYPGHPFRGNQYAGGGSVGAHHGASLSAHRATVRAHNNGDKASHKAASSYHKEAQKLHEKAGNKKMATHHKEMAAYHAGVANRLKKTEGSEMNDIEKVLPANFKDHLKKCSKALSDAADAHKNMLDAISKDDGEGDEEKTKKSEPVGDIAKAVADGVREALKDFKSTTPPAFRLPSEAPHRSASVRKAAGSQAVEEDLRDDIQKRADEGDDMAKIAVARRTPIHAIETLGA